MSTITYYDVLHLNSTCTHEELKKTYRKLALLYHPDKNPGGLKIFQLIGRAYRVLSDPERRRRYDRNIERRRRVERQKWLTTIRRFRVPLLDFYVGRSRTLSYDRREPCRECGPRKVCQTCGGKGTVRIEKTVEVRIEKGVPDGHKIVFPGEGDAEPGFDPGDMVVELVEIEDGAFKRFGSVLCLEVNLTLFEALCGFEKIIQTPDSRELVIASERGATTPDGTFRYVRGEGMPLCPGSSERDKLLLKFNVHWPQFLDERTVGNLSRILPRGREETCFTGTRVTMVDAEIPKLKLYEEMFKKE